MRQAVCCGRSCVKVQVCSVLESAAAGSCVSLAAGCVICLAHLLTSPPCLCVCLSVCVCLPACLPGVCLQQCVPGQACHTLDDAWRVCVAIGAIPAIATFYLRSKLPETPRFTVHVAKDTSKAEADVVAVLANSDEFRTREKKGMSAPSTGFTRRESNDWVLTRRNFMVSFFGGGFVCCPHRGFVC